MHRFDAGQTNRDDKNTPTERQTSGEQKIAQEIELEKISNSKYGKWHCKYFVFVSAAFAQSEVYDFLRVWNNYLSHEINHLTGKMWSLHAFPWRKFSNRRRTSEKFTVTFFVDFFFFDFIRSAVYDLWTLKMNHWNSSFGFIFKEIKIRFVERRRFSFFWFHQHEMSELKFIYSFSIAGMCGCVLSRHL